MLLLRKYLFFFSAFIKVNSVNVSIIIQHICILNDGSEISWEMASQKNALNLSAITRFALEKPAIVLKRSSHKSWLVTSHVHKFMEYDSVNKSIKQ